MDLASAFKSEVFRPLVTLVIPGAVALAPYVVLVRTRYAPVRIFWNDHTTAAFVVIAIAALAVGRVLETIGARIEHRWDDRLNRLSNGVHRADWWRYLRLAIRDEPVGQRYLRTVTLALKFELAMVPALPVMFAGICALEYELDLWTWWGLGLLGIGVGAVAAYLLWESHSSAELLARVRRELVDEYATGSAPQASRAPAKHPEPNP